MDFKSYFEAASEQQWKEKIIRDLKGGQLEDLIWESEIGKIDPVLFNYQNKYGRVIPKPNSVDNQWLISASFDCKNSSSANQKILKSLAGGINQLRLHNVNGRELNILFKDVMLDIIHTELLCDSSISKDLKLAVDQFCLENNLKSDRIKVTSDPLTDQFKGGTDTITGDQFYVDGSFLANAGTNLDHQIGIMLTMAHEYLVHQITNNGSSIATASKNISFVVGIGNSYFAEIAKIRALRLLWNSVVEEYDHSDAYAEIHGVNANFNFSNQDVHNNLLRGTTAAMAGIIGGVESMEVLPYDFNMDQQIGDGERLAKNIQLLLQEESYFSQVKDASGGAYYIEQLTDRLIENGWELFKKIEQEGGIRPFYQNGSLKKLIEQDLSKKVENFRSKSLKLVGVNIQPNKAETNIEETITDLNNSAIQTYRLAQTKLDA